MNNDPLYQSIFPILQYEEAGNVSIAGTSVLVEYRDLPFLVTAAHVLRDNGSLNPLLLALECGNVVLAGPALMTPKIDDYDFDLAVFDLRSHKVLMKSLAGYKTISLEDPPVLPIHARQHFFVFGFPWRKTFHDKDKALINIKPLSYTTDEAAENIYTKYALSKQNHIVVKYKPKATINQDKRKTVAPMPHGASGGPLFRVLVDEHDYAIMLILEGILAKWKGNEVIVSTRKATLRKFVSDACFGGL